MQTENYTQSTSLAIPNLTASQAISIFIIIPQKICTLNTFLEWPAHIYFIGSGNVLLETLELLYIG